MALDSAGLVYVAGGTSSAGFPRTRHGSFHGEFDDAFVAKLDANLSTILAATFLGGSAGDHANALTLDGAGNVYVAGWTASSNVSGVGPASAQGFSGGEDVFVAKLDGNLHILAASYLGGTGDDEAFALSLGNAGNVYVAGVTTSFDFSGVGLSAADSTFAGGAEAFIEP